MDYLLDNDILFKKNKNEELTKKRVCIPVQIVKMLTNQHHSMGGNHISPTNLAYMMSKLFHHPRMLEIIKQATKNCLTCTLNPEPTKITIHGSERSFKNLRPGEVVQVDCLYLPIAKGSRFKAAVLFCDTLSSYITCIPISKINCKNEWCLCYPSRNQKCSVK